MSQEVKAVRQWNFFFQWIECYFRKTFILEKLYIKCGEETSARAISEKLKLAISLDQLFKVLYSLLLSYGKLKAIEIYGK